MKKWNILLFFVAAFLSLSVNAWNGDKNVFFAEDIANKGWVNKKDNLDEYRVSDPIKRQDFLSVLVKYKGLNDGVLCQGDFLDVSQSDPNDWICRFGEIGLEQKFTSRKFLRNGGKYLRPGEKVSRVEAIWGTLNALDIPLEKNKDTQIQDKADWMEDALWTAYKHKLILRKDLFATDKITRGEFFAFLSRALSYKEHYNPYQSFLTSAQGRLGNLVFIPSIGRMAPIRDIVSKKIVGSEAGRIILDGLKEGVVRYPGTPYPGKPGTSVILGHSSNFPWIKSPFNDVFSTINTLQNSDGVLVVYDKQMHIYQVSEEEIFFPSQVDKIVKHDSQPALSLLTCWPIGSDRKRLMVTTKLTNSVPL